MEEPRNWLVWPSNESDRLALDKASNLILNCPGLGDAIKNSLTGLVFATTLPSGPCDRKQFTKNSERPGIPTSKSQQMSSALTLSALIAWGLGLT
jgi:hypothetical protein